MSSEAKDAEAGRKKLKAGLHKGEIKFVLLGKKLKGGFVLVKLRGREENAWLLVKERDEYASRKEVTKDSRSVLSSRKI